MSEAESHEMTPLSWKSNKDHEKNWLGGELSQYVGPLKDVDEPLKSIAQEILLQKIGD